MGRLQQLAGSDQRITTTAAGFIESVEANRYWTGVWDSEKPEGKSHLVGIWRDTLRDNVVLDPDRSIESVGPNTVSQRDQYARVAKSSSGIGEWRGNFPIGWEMKV